MQSTESTVSGKSLVTAVDGAFRTPDIWPHANARASRMGAKALLAGEVPGTVAPVSVMFLAPFVIAVPLLAVALSSTGIAAALGAAIVASWIALTLGGLHAPWARKGIHLPGGLFVVLTLALLPFNSLAFLFDFWAAVVMFLSAASRGKMPL